MTNEIQRFALEHQRLGIPIIYGIDAVHGHNNVLGATMFPHQFGLGATLRPRLARELASRHRAAMSGRPESTGTSRPVRRHSARPALGPLLRAVRRGPVLGRRARWPRPSTACRAGTWAPGPGRRDRSSTSSATRLPTAASDRDERDDLTERELRDDPPAFVHPRRRRRRRDRDDQLRLGERRAGARVRGADHRGCCARSSASRAS